MTPLLHAAAAHCGPNGGGKRAAAAAACLKLLLKRGANLEAKDRAGEGVFHKAARSGNTQVVALLLSAGRKGGGAKGGKGGGGASGVGARNKRRETPLHLASAEGHEEAVAQLLNYGADLWALDCDGHSPLSLAASTGNASVVTLLLTRGGGSATVLRFLEEGGGGGEDGEGRKDGAGGEAGAGDEGGSGLLQACNPLMEAAARGEDEVVALLLAEGWNPRLQLEVRGRVDTALLRAVEGGFAPTVALLVRAGAAWQPGKAEEALLAASRLGQRAVLHWLLGEAGLLAPHAAPAVVEGGQQPQQEHGEAGKGKSASISGGGGNGNSSKKEGPLAVLTMTREQLLLAVLEAAVLGGKMETIVEVRCS